MAITRATFMPCSPSGKAQPRTTSSTAAGSICERRSDSCTTEMARSSGRCPESALDPAAKRSPHA